MESRWSPKYLFAVVRGLASRFIDNKDFPHWLEKAKPGAAGANIAWSLDWRKPGMTQRARLRNFGVRFGVNVMPVLPEKPACCREVRRPRRQRRPYLRPSCTCPSYTAPPVGAGLRRFTRPATTDFILRRPEGASKDVEPNRGVSQLSCGGSSFQAATRRLRTRSLV